MGNHMGQMGQMGHMPGGMSMGYQGWGTPPQQSGYAPQGYQQSQNYQGWGAAQTGGQQMPQWGSYGTNPQQGYGYGKTKLQSPSLASLNPDPSVLPVVFLLVDSSMF